MSGQFVSEKLNNKPSLNEKKRHKMKKMDGNYMSDKHSELPSHRLWQPTTAKWFVVVFGLSLAYAVIRYHFVGGVAWRHFPLFILNKATSLAAVGFLSGSYLVGKIIHWYDHDPRLRLVVIKFLGLVGFFMAGIHAFFSFCLLTPAYYSKYYSPDGRLNLQGELAITAGVIALIMLMGPAITTLPMMAKALGGMRWKRNQRLGYVTLALVAVHLVALGLKGWLAPRGWHGGMPPISLVAVLLVLIPLFVKKKLDHEKNSSQEESEVEEAG
jgi:DMSO/TMAO reductase YedYZ heme-binding membrane subunit